MKGLIHRYLGFISVTFVIALLTAVHLGEFLWFYIGIGCMVGASLLLGQVEKHRYLDRKKRKELREQGKDASRNKFKHWFFRHMHEFSYLLLLIAMFLTIFTADFLDHHPRLLSVALSSIAILVLSFTGATLPDIDFDWGVRFHRNPITHSHVIPIFVWGLCMIAFPYEYKEFIILPACFALGFGTHLISDAVKSDTHGTWNVLRELLDFSQSPGSIRQVKASWEHAWLIFTGIGCVVCFGLSIPRFYGTHGFDWTNMTEQGVFYWMPQTILVFIFTSINIVCIFVLYYLGRRARRKK